MELVVINRDVVGAVKSTAIFALHPNYTMKINRVNEQSVNYITASKTNESEFNMRKYTKIK